ncbi:imidazolonepropionase [Formosa algae]|uniref:Imidazolonepropionase n=1 Tax=Formosa algae TaxID=225843 RepID=A0A9X0YQC4_9FLAO|nr:imidazolonepropionase [Formosa algae]MBP1841073.1 imidazolonepropionase [Formosa algae]MDQ0336507.1 imidazolonepropionase [Formosa algae]OEI81465.1 imidazolonepropionase [Formosa algae]
MSILITNIKQLLQTRNHNVLKVSGKEMKDLPFIENAYLLIEHDTIVEFGKMEDMGDTIAEKTIDATNKVVLPAWCDSHTHLVYSGNRVQEFIDRINGLSYEEIANRGGGILNSAENLQNTTEDELYNQAINRLQNLMKLGTGAIEIKSGYGLSTEAELKILRVIKKIKHDYNILVKSTFLGAHANPKMYKDNKDGYIDDIINQMIPTIEKEQLANYIDVFCEKGYFSLEDTDKILAAGVKHGLTPKIHVNQFDALGGVALGVKHNALSVDHLEIMTPKDIEVLKGSRTMPVALPSCSYFLSIPYAPARAIIDAGLPLALASDYNPGTTPSGNMNFVVSTACIKMKMTPEEAINAATINGAYAMGISNMYGSITRGKKGNVIITEEIPSYNYLPYAFGDNNIDTVIIHGKVIE